MEAADDTASGVAPTCRLIVGCQDDMAGATGGAEDRGLRQCEQVEVAEGGQSCGRIAAHALAAFRGITGVSGAKRDRFHSASFCRTLGRIAFRTGNLAVLNRSLAALRPSHFVVG